MLTIIKDERRKRIKFNEFLISQSYLLFQKSHIYRLIRYICSKKITDTMLLYEHFKGSKIKNNPFGLQVDFTEKMKSYLCIQ
ncbi:hypothetical protein EGI16_06080 [Chryseobacterium sp. G0240]|nr:hypothetical protein EGI16_06080 [Chryseobacterium sp. G0240]